MNFNTNIIHYERKELFWDIIPQSDSFKDWNLLLKVSKQGLIISKDCKLKFVNFLGQSIWPAPLHCQDKPQNAVISDNRLIISTNTEDYHAWGFLGPVLLIDLETGKIVKELKGERIFSLNNGEFILGLEGYEYFHSWLYDRNGKLKQKWRSYGEYLNIKNRIIVIEENRQNPDSSYLSRLHLDGSIEKVKKLKSPRSSNPVKLNETAFIFENAGEIFVINNELKIIQTLKLLDYALKDASSFNSRIKPCDDEFIVEILERIAEPIENYRTHVWKVQIPKI